MPKKDKQYFVTLYGDKKIGELIFPEKVKVYAVNQTESGGISDFYVARRHAKTSPVMLVEYNGPDKYLRVLAWDGPIGLVTDQGFLFPALERLLDFLKKASGKAVAAYEADEELEPLEFSQFE